VAPVLQAGKLVLQLGLDLLLEDARKLLEVLGDRDLQIADITYESRKRWRFFPFFY